MKTTVSKRAYLVTNRKFDIEMKRISGISPCKAAKEAAIKDMRKAHINTSFLYKGGIIKHVPELCNRSFSL